MYQDLIDDAMHSIEVLVKSDSGEVVSSVCALVRFAPSNHNTEKFFCHKETTVILSQLNDLCIDDKGPISISATQAEKRTKELLWSRFQIGME